MEMSSQCLFQYEPGVLGEVRDGEINVNTTHRCVQRPGPLNEFRVRVTHLGFLLKCIF